MAKRAIVLLLLFAFAKVSLFAQQGELLIYHNIQTDQNGNIVPWYNADPAIAYDHNLNTTWNFWFNMRRDMNGLPYYMNHQVWNGNFDDPRGIGKIELLHQVCAAPVDEPVDQGVAHLGHQIVFPASQRLLGERF